MSENNHEEIHHCLFDLFIDSVRTAEERSSGERKITLIWEKTEQVAKADADTVPLNSNVNAAFTLGTLDGSIHRIEGS